ncbi:hypothetical protein GCM10009809_11240 [Isoptericola hypogeus]|uniref:Uncharacterized protein n=1 Tax=Isoptericola hypogeus TaxID=300179 RepID=A0ABN2J2Z6_9MICO
MRVLGVALVFVAAAAASVYVIEAFAPDISPLGRFAVMLPVYVGGGLSVRAAAQARRRRRAESQVP